MGKTHLGIVSASAASIAATIVLGGAASASAGELGHFGPPVADVRDYVMPAKPGFASWQPPSAAING